MRFSAAAGLLVAGLSLVVSRAAAGQVTSPAASPQTSVAGSKAPSPAVPMTARCSEAGAALFPVPALRQRDGWYGRQLRAAAEGQLCTLGRGSTETYRFTWIPSFSPTVAVRATFTDSAVVLVGKRLNGAGGYDPGRLVVDRTVRVTLQEAERIRALVDSVGLWRKTPPVDTRHGLDGAQWIVEGVRGDAYHAIDWWSPEEDGPGRHVRRLGIYLLELAGLLPPDQRAVY